MVYRLSVLIFKLFAKIYLRGKAYGIENFPKNTPYIGVVNHKSNMDAVAMSLVMKQRVHTMAKDSLFRVPVLKWWLRAVHMFPVVRESSDRQAFQHALNLVEKGEILFMAPEGTRRREGKQRIRPKIGFIRLAQMTGVPGVPVAIYNTDKVLPPGAWFPRAVKVRVRVGQPIKLEKIEVNLKNKEKLQQQADMVMDVIYEMIEQFEEEEKDLKH